MNLPNKLTMFRIILIPVFLILLYLKFPGNNYAALAVFAIASITDFLDGRIARKYNMVTDFGKFADPLADKMLVFTALIWFTAQGTFPAWATVVVIFREFAVTGLRLIAVTGGLVIAAAPSGKLKTTVTMFGIIIMLLPVPKIVCTVIMILIVVTTVYSGAEYFIKNRKILLSNM